MLLNVELCELLLQLFVAERLSWHFQVSLNISLGRVRKPGGWVREAEAGDFSHKLYYGFGQAGRKYGGRYGGKHSTVPSPGGGASLPRASGAISGEQRGTPFGDHQRRRVGIARGNRRHH